MKPYYLHEANVELPEDWADHSTNIFVHEGEQPNGRATLMFLRDQNVPEGGDLEAYLEHQTAKLRGTLPEFRVLQSSNIIICREPAVQVDYQWRSPAGLDLYVRQAFVLTGKVVLVISLSAMADHFLQHDELWTQVLDSMVLRKLNS